MTLNMNISVVNFPSVWKSPTQKVVERQNFTEVTVTPSCSNCGDKPVVANRECAPCRMFRERRGYARTEKLIIRAQKRRIKNVSKVSIELASIPLPLISVPLESQPCSCGRPCGRYADNFKATDGLSTYCRQLIHHQAQRPVTP